MSGGRVRVAVLGAGRAGGALVRNLQEHNYHVSIFWTRTPVRAEAARAAGLPATSGALPPALAQAELVFLAVSDGAVAGLAQQIADAQLVRPGAVFAHLAGSLDLAPLAPLKAAGASVGSLHPLVSMASAEASLAGAACAIESADVRAASRLEAVAKDLGLAVIHPKGDRARYHAAACMVGNYPQVLMEAGILLLVASGLSRDEARRALGPLLVSAARNAGERDGPDGLSGPIVRGDTAVVRRHLAALGSERTLDDVDRLYRAAGVLAADMTGEAAREVRALLEAPKPGKA